MIWALVSAAIAGGITVKETAGQELAKVRGPTTVTFEPWTGGSEGTTIYEVLEESQGLASGFGGGWAAASSTSYREVCLAPCTLELDPGSYRFRVGISEAISKKFSVVADGTAQTWAVRKARPVPWATGLLATSFGAAALAGGGLLLAVDSDGGARGTYTALAGGGAAVMAVGIGGVVAGMPRGKRRR